MYYINSNTLKSIDQSNVLDDIYYQKAYVPSKSELENYIKSKKSNAKIIKYIKSFDTLQDCITDIKDSISKITLKVPLYDVYSRNLYLIVRENVYFRVIHQHYRFPDNQLLTYFDNKKEKMKNDVQKLELTKQKNVNLGDFKKDDVNYSIKSSNMMKIREYTKLNLMINFLQQFNLNLLESSYIYVFYNYSNEVGKNITHCTRPSFLPHLIHINPYYNRTELINMGLNMEIIKPGEKYYDKYDIVELCKIIRENDISSETILDHQLYIIKNDGIGLIQYYSLQGSFFMNQYLRGLSGYSYKNSLLETNINATWTLINNAPPFDKSYTLYRFIQNDDHIKNLNIGDIYVENSFISTTRDPFYRSDIYKFGFILIKIKIPKNVSGVALCMETISHFPEEQEILLSPLSKLKLVKKDKNAPYYHTDKIEESKVQTRYEFEYYGKDNISFKKRDILDNNDLIDFLKIKKTESLTINEKISYFVTNYSNPLFQFKTHIGNDTYDIIMEWYDSTGAYKDFYAVSVNNGFFMYTLVDKYVLFTIELGENNEGTYMCANYYFRHSSTSDSTIIDDDNFIDFLCKVAYYFEIESIVLFSTYTSCDHHIRKITKENADYLKNIYYGGNYSVDFYNYFKHKQKKYSKFDSTEIKPRFSYYQLDRLFTIDPLTILNDKDRDEIYQIYINTYKDNFGENKNTLADFYIWIIDCNCRMANDLVKKMQKYYDKDNPFMLDYYILDPSLYLYNKELINNYPNFKKNKSLPQDKNRIIDIDLPKNNYRINNVSINRIPRIRQLEKADF